MFLVELLIYFSVEKYVSATSEVKEAKHQIDQDNLHLEFTYKLHSQMNWPQNQETFMPNTCCLHKLSVRKC
jgi:hypothetical protein